MSGRSWTCSTGPACCWVGGEHRSSFWLSVLLIVLDHVDEAHNSAGPTRYLDADRDDLAEVVSQLAVIAAAGSVGWT